MGTVCVKQLKVIQDDTLVLSERFSIPTWIPEKECKKIEKIEIKIGIRLKERGPTRLQTIQSRTN